MMTAPTFESATKPVNLAPVTGATETFAKRLYNHLEEIPEGRNCYCYSCVELRNPVVRPASQTFRAEMLQLGFADADTSVELRQHIGSNFYDDVVFILNRIDSLPPGSPEHVQPRPIPNPA